MAGGNFKTRTGKILKTLSGGYLVEYTDGTLEVVPRSRIIVKGVNLIKVRVDG